MAGDACRDPGMAGASERVGGRQGLGREECRLHAAPPPSPQVHTTEWPGGAIRGQLHWAASPGNDALSVYNDLSGSGSGGGGGTSGAARRCDGTLRARALALALGLAATLALPL